MAESSARKILPQDQIQEETWQRLFGDTCPLAKSFSYSFGHVFYVLRGLKTKHHHKKLINCKCEITKVK